jgi:hypothetical protein
LAEVELAEPAEMAEITATSAEQDIDWKMVPRKALSDLSMVGWDVPILSEPSMQ